MLDQVLPHIQREGKRDEAALEGVLEVLVHAHQGQGNEDQTQDNDADDDAADLAGGVIITFAKEILTLIAG